MSSELTMQLAGKVVQINDDYYYDIKNWKPGNLSFLVFQSTISYKLWAILAS